MMKISKIKKNPNNPRFIRDGKFEQLVNSILSLPKMLRLREIVLNNKGECESQGGNMRAEALRHISKLSLAELTDKINSLSVSDERKLESIEIFSRFIKTKEVPAEWVKYADDFGEDELREFIIKDNNNFGGWDWDLLANNFDPAELESWGLDVPPPATLEDLNIDDFFAATEATEPGGENIVLHYTKEEAEKVRAALRDHGKTPEAAVRTLLGL